MEGYFHRPVLTRELLELLNPRPGGVYVDANLGGGGHAESVLDRLDGKGLLVGIDLDVNAIKAATARLSRFTNFRPILGDFAALDRLLDGISVGQIDGIYFDLGVSSPQLDDAARGFSIKGAGPLDMRFGPSQQTTAAHLVNEASESDLARIIRTFGEERWAAAIARRIVGQRPIRDTVRLAEVVSSAIPRRFHPPKIHPATRTFQALRIAVNKELENLQDGLEAAVVRLRPGGRLCCIAYHSLEDRIVKQTLQRHAGRGDARQTGLPRGFPRERPRALLRILTRRPVRPEASEIESNPRARSARLRAAEKVREDTL